MLKWTVLSRRDTQEPNKRLSLNLPSTEALPNTPRQKAKRRRSSVARRSSTQKRCNLDALEADKENQFHSTPIKSSSSVHEAFSPFRDLSNLTPNNEKNPRLSLTKSNPKVKIKKKKQCLEDHKKPRDSDGSNYFTPFEAVDSHIESILAEELMCSCKKPLETKQLETKDNTNPTENLSTKEDKSLEIIEDVIEATSKDSLPGYKPYIHIKNTLDDTVKVSPLVRKLLDIKFSRASLEIEHNNSSCINDMSLDKLVDALLEQTSTENDNTSLNTSMAVQVDDKEQENALLKEGPLDVHSEASSDSGFKSTNDNSHQLDNNFQCKCNNLPENTIIQLNETYNERAVDVARKRSSVTPEEAQQAKKTKLESDSYTLKRQRCIRRKKAENFRKKLSRINGSVIESATVSQFWSTQKQFDFPSDEESFLTPVGGIQFENTPLRGCYLENKDIILNTPLAGYDPNSTIRKCLNFESPIVSECSSFADSTRKTIVDVRGSMDLKIFSDDNWIFVNVIRCSDLYRADGETINAYVKVAISDRLLSSRSKKRNAVLQRTAVQSNSSRPIFNHTFKFPILPADNRKKVLLEVWHRDRTTMTSEFLGCMSFDVQDVCSKVIHGSYRLLPQAEGRLGNVPITNDLIGNEIHLHQDMEDHNQEGGCGESVIEEILNVDGRENELKRSTNKAILSEQQKYADEHLFLRYLELDPIEGPEAIPAALQRKATGNKFGRTPFTQTKQLSRPPKSGFGFSVVWTHPPRIERVEKGLPAERAGILPGDYIIFVDKHNVVMMPEIDILNLIRSYGNQLTLEIFRRNPFRNGSVPSVHQKSTTIVTPSSIKTDSNINIPSSTATTAIRRPSTVCSTNATSIDYRRRKLNLPQVTFSSEKPSTNPDESRKRAIYQLIGKEQQYATALQFAITRFVSALAERRDLITSSEHKTLFQNCEELLRITEDILDHLVHEDGEMDPNILVKIYRCKLHEFTTAYKKYCMGIKKADCVLANKMKNSNSDFVRFIQSPAIPRRRPDLTVFIHKPLEHYREVLKILMAIQSHTPSKHEDSAVINQIVHEMQVTYKEITSAVGLMEPCGEGRPLLCVQDLENRLVFTKCKPFVLNKPGRQWIFGGDLSRIDGRNVRQYWTLLFNDLILFAKASRDRVLFITEDPLPLAHITDMFFNIRKKDTEFRIIVNPEGNKEASSPIIHCGPDLTRTPKKNSNKKTVILRAPTTELKAVWQNLLQRQIFQLNSGMDGSSPSSPMESPEVPINSSVGTLQSVETSSIRRQSQFLANDYGRNNNEHLDSDFQDVKKQLETLIEHKCKLMGKSSLNGKCNAIHLEQWMKGQLDNEETTSHFLDTMDEVWTEEKLKKRSEELHLINLNSNIGESCKSNKINDRGCEETVFSSDQEEQSPSKSTTTESQVTVRSSPLVSEPVPVCRQCHKNCLSNVLANNNKINQTHFNDCRQNESSKNCNEQEIINDSTKTNDWQGFLLLGVCSNPVASLLTYDPFRVQPQAPKISVAPPSPENSTKNCVCLNNENCNTKIRESTIIHEPDISPDDSPLAEDHPYHSLSSSAQTLRRFGTVSSLERCGSEQQDDNLEIYDENHYSSEESECFEDECLGIDNRAFTNSSTISWTTRASKFVAEKMAFFDYRNGGGIFDRYVKTPEPDINGEEAQEEETSGGTSGEEIWGTPTSGGDLDDSLRSPNSPNLDGKFSPNNELYTDENLDDTEIMMDELLMTPPITGAILRGLLPRRTLEPLIEEDFSDTTSSSSSSEPTSPHSGSSEQDNQSGSAADTCSPDVVDCVANEPFVSIAPSRIKEIEMVENVLPLCQNCATQCPMAQSQNHLFQEIKEKTYEGDEQCCAEVNASQMVPHCLNMPRSESYRKIVEAAEDALLETTDKNVVENLVDPAGLFQNFKPAAKFVNIERVQRNNSVRIFEFFNIRRLERRIYNETFEENRQPMASFSNSDEVCDISVSPRKSLPKSLNDNRNGRFWRQLSRRRTIEKPPNPA